MIKRISILFNTHLRKKMESDEQFRTCRGLQEAQRCLSAVLAMYLHPEHKVDYEPPDWRVAKYFDGSHCEWQELCALFDRAGRLNIVLNSRGYQDGYEYVSLELLFVSKRQGRNCEENVEFSFSSASGAPGSIQSHTRGISG